MDAITSDVDLVTLTIGGNDSFFTPIAGACITGDCLVDVANVPENTSGDTWEDFIPTHISSTVKARLKNVYSEIKSRAPSATVVVLGYPHLFAGTSVCIQAPGFSQAEQQFVRRTVDLLNQTIAEAAREEGVHFVDVRERFDGHGICAGPNAWIRGLKLSEIEYSFHPFEAGQRAYGLALNQFLETVSGPRVANGFSESGMPKNPTPIP